MCCNWTDIDKSAIDLSNENENAQNILTTSSNNYQTIHTNLYQFFHDKKYQTSYHFGVKIDYFSFYKNWKFVLLIWKIFLLILLSISHLIFFVHGVWKVKNNSSFFLVYFLFFSFLSLIIGDFLLDLSLMN